MPPAPCSHEKEQHGCAPSREAGCNPGEGQNAATLRGAVTISITIAPQDTGAWDELRKNRIFKELEGNEGHRQAAESGLWEPEMTGLAHGDR